MRLRADQVSAGHQTPGRQLRADLPATPPKLAAVRHWWQIAVPGQAGPGVVRPAAVARPGENRPVVAIR